MKSSIIGKSFVISTKSTTGTALLNRTVKIVNEFKSSGQRYYRVEEEGKLPFDALADRYDQIFNITPKTVRPKNYRSNVGIQIRQEIGKSKGHEA